MLAPAGHGKTALTAAAAEAMTTAGRPVVALATTNKAVAELRGAGLDASTIARFRLDGAAFERGSVVIIDEVSQVSTRDAHAVVAAVAATSGAVLWCLGDDDQGRSVQPGGLAAELRRLAEHQQVAAAELTVNRRQRNPAERQALAIYRRGDLTGSQAIRDAQGWEHVNESPAATRDALARAAVADADRLGDDQVVVLAVSHADCEDLADRIRAVRAARGELTGLSLTGPGWGANHRPYAAGDRVLFHTSLTVDGRRFTNGTTGTIAAIHDNGAAALLDDGTALIIPAGFVRGERIDGTPNLSHGWARTIDGAQGGTWEQAHLLATPNLDRLSAYVAQSRGRQPTQTWNTTPERNGEEHGNVVIDPRDPAEQILAAMAGSLTGASPPPTTPGSLTGICAPNAPNTNRPSPTRRLTSPLCTPASPPSSSNGNRRRSGSGTSWVVSTSRSPRPAASGRSAPAPVGPTASCSPPATRPTPSLKPFRRSCATTEPSPTARTSRSTSTPGGREPTSGATRSSPASTSDSLSIGPPPSWPPFIRTTPSPTVSNDCARHGPTSPGNLANTPSET
ncbi:MAG: AAA family ATPase [Acidimicrobiales bacterium]